MNTVFYIDCSIFSSNDSCWASVHWVSYPTMHFSGTWSSIFQMQPFYSALLALRTRIDDTHQTQDTHNTQTNASQQPLPWQQHPIHMQRLPLFVTTHIVWVVTNHLWMRKHSQCILNDRHRVWRLFVNPAPHKPARLVSNELTQPWTKRLSPVQRGPNHCVVML